MVRRFLRGIKYIIILAFSVFVLLLIYLSITEFRPPDTISFEVSSSDETSLELDREYRVVSFNIGYGGLGKESDFFMDGGQEVLPKNKNLVEKNLEGISNILQDINPDFYLLQEVDIDSKRSFNINQRKFFDESLDLISFYAPNYKVNYVPFPLPPLGKVDSGLLTLSYYPAIKSERQSLPVPFKWPIRLANLKRCLLVNHYPIKDSDKELVFINLHLEAYDDSGGREEQTKMLIDYMESEYQKGNYVIAGGDFNQSFFESHELPFRLSEDLWKPGLLDLDLFPQGYGVLRDELKIPTCRSLHMPYNDEFREDSYYIIDGFIVSPNVYVKEIETYNQNFEFSDHNPVVINFELN